MSLTHATAAGSHNISTAAWDADHAYAHGTTGNATAEAITGQVNVADYGALGNGSHDDTSAIQAALDAAGDTGGRVVLPIMGATTNYIVSDALSLPSHVEVTGPGASLVLTEAGALFSVDTVAELIHVHDLRLVGTGDAEQWAVSIDGTGGLAGSSHSFDHLECVNFGDNTGAGGALRIQADAASLAFHHNDVSGKGVGVYVNGPSDALYVAHNHLVSSVTRLVDIVTSPGAAAVAIRHNNMSGPDGAVRVQSANGTIYLQDNEFESVGTTISNASNAAFELLSQNIFCVGNWVNVGANASYCFYLGDGKYNIVLAFNRGYNSASYKIVRTNAEPTNIYLGNISYQAAGANLYSTDPAVRFPADIWAVANGKGLVLTNAAGTYIRRVRLNDTGDGFIFEAPV